MSPAPPSTLYLALTEACNLRCQMCHIWMGADPPSALSLDERLDLVRQFAAWSPGGTVALGGGEPTLRLDAVLSIARACRRLRLRSVMNTNGTLAPERLHELRESGPDVVLVSLDSRHREVHDRLRGRRGTHDAAVAFVRALAGDRAGSAVRHVGVSTVVSRHNAGDLANIARWAIDLGADLVLVQPLIWTLARRTPGRVDPFFRAAAPRSDEAARESLRQLCRMRDDGLPIAIDPSLASSMQQYYEDPMSVPPGSCNSAERNLMVDVAGAAQLCFSMRHVLGEPLGHARHTPLRDLYESEEADLARARLRDCNLPCAVLLCHSRGFSSLTASLGLARG